MTRHVLSLVLIAGISAFVGAQGPNALQPEKRAALFGTNKALIERLVEKTVESSLVPNDHVKRAESYHKVLVEFSKSIEAAKLSRDSARLKELTSHLNDLLDRGLAPTLHSAWLQAAKGSSADDYTRTQTVLLGQVDALLQSVANDESARASLEQTRTRLQQKIGE